MSRLVKPIKLPKLKPRNTSALAGKIRSGGGVHQDQRYQADKYGARGEEEILAIQDGLEDIESFLDRIMDEIEDDNG